jgi:thiamine kinase-like enzyme
VSTASTAPSADELVGLGLAPVLGARPLTGGRGGRTWRLDTDDGAFVLHRRRRASGAPDVSGVAREARVTAATHAVGAGPEVIAVDAPRGLLVTRWLPGHALTARDLVVPERVDAVGALLRRLHGARVRARRLDPVATRRRYLDALVARGLTLAPGAARAEPAVDLIAQALGRIDVRDVLVHGDLVAANLIAGRGAVHAVDLEYAGRADPAYDLGNLVATGRFTAAGVQRLVAAYAGERDDALVARVHGWSVVARHAWIAWATLGEGLGPQAAQWRSWSARASAAMGQAQRRGSLDTVARDLDLLRA